MVLGLVYNRGEKGEGVVTRRWFRGWLTMAGRVVAMLVGGGGDW